MVVFVRTEFNYDVDEASRASGIDCEKRVDPDTGEVVFTPSLTKQGFAEECDINTIVRRFNITGQLPTNVRMPSYGDFTDIPSFDQAMLAIRSAEESFMAMPADIRARFNNDPGLFVDFCSDEGNREEAKRLGLVKPDPEAAAALVPVVPPKVDSNPSV